MGISYHTPLNYGLAMTVTGAVILLIDIWMLGGPVGIGTFGSGVVMQIIYNIIRFEPRKVEHKSAAETAAVLCKGQPAE